MGYCAGCSAESFRCAGNESCAIGNFSGTCESNGYCSYEDSNCDSGRSYGSLAPEGLAGTCVPPMTAAMDSSTSDGDPGTTDPSTTTTSTGGSSAPTTGTTDPDPSGSTTGAGDPTTTTTDFGSTGWWGTDGDPTGQLDDCPDDDLGSDVGTPVATGSTQGMGNSANPPFGCGPPNSADYAAVWTAPADGTYTIDTFGSNFDTVLHVKETCDGQSLACDDDTMDLQSRVMLDAQAGNSYVIVVDGFFRTGDFVLNIAGP